MPNLGKNRCLGPWRRQEQPRAHAAKVGYTEWLVHHKPIL